MTLKPIFFIFGFEILTHYRHENDHNSDLNQDNLMFLMSY